MNCTVHHRNIIKRVGQRCLALFLVCSVTLSLHAQTHSATKALVLSAILPGAGQVYNHQAWKIPIIYGALGGVAYYTYNNYTLMKTYKDEYLYRVHNEDAYYNSDLASYPTSNIKNMYDSYNQTFQLSIIISVAIYGLNLLDAYVFGHLFDFQINDDLSLFLFPSFENNTPFIGSPLQINPTATIVLRF